MIEIPTMTIVARAVFYENNKYYQQLSLNECLYKIKKVKIESKDEFKKIDIKNCMYYYFDGITTDRDIYSVDILLDEKIYENISVYDISYKTSMGSKPFSIRFNKIDGFITVLDCKIKHLV